VTANGTGRTTRHTQPTTPRDLPSWTHGHRSGAVHFATNPLRAEGLVSLGAFTYRVVMADVVYVSEVVIERREGPVREAHLPGESDPVVYGVHGAVAEHYGVPEGKFPTHATTLDHVVGAAAG